MIRAFLFDLDGTLVQTEKLKAQSYASAVRNLTDNAVSVDDVVEHYKQYVGLTRKEIATGIMNHFGLAAISESYRETYSVDESWEAFVSIRLEVYEEMISDTSVIIDHRWPRAIQLLGMARARHCVTGLATMSRRDQAMRVLKILGLTDAFDSIATVDDVAAGKPDPEIYLLSAERLSVRPNECLVLEDSPAGVESALSAGMNVVAVATPFTGDLLKKSNLLPRDRIVTDHEQLVSVVKDLVIRLDVGQVERE